MNKKQNIPLRIRKRGRVPKHLKLHTSIPAIIGLIYSDSLDFYVSIRINRNFINTSELTDLKKAIKKAVKEFDEKHTSKNKMQPIICCSDLSQQAIDKTKSNLLKIEIVFFTDKRLETIFDVDEQEMTDFVELISRL